MDTPENTQATELADPNMPEEQALKDEAQGGKQKHFGFMDLFGGVAPKADHRNFGLLTEAELADMLGLKAITLSKWRRGDGSEGAQQAPAHVQIGKTIFYQVRDVYAWLDANTVGEPRAAR
jgi:hypothetical protein